MLKSVGFLNKWDEFGFLETLRFVAPDPTFYDPAQWSLNWSLGIVQTELEFPITFPIEFSESLIQAATNTITYDGTWLNYPMIVITGPISGFNIENTDLSDGSKGTLSVQLVNKDELNLAIIKKLRPILTQC